MTAKKKPGPQKGTVKLTDAHRDKIRKSKILDRLIEHAEGGNEMTQTQVTAGLGLLKKALPDLQPVAPDNGEDASVQHVFKWKE